MRKLGKERRSAILYARIKPSNKAHLVKFLKRVNKLAEVRYSESMLVDALIEAHKNQDAGKTIHTK
jgi:hypothetical protein